MRGARPLAGLALAAAALLLAVAAPLAAADDVPVDLAAGQTFSTNWIHVPAGQEVHWETVNGTGFVTWGVDSQPYGELAGGDGEVAAGCALATQDFDVRVHMENTVLYNVKEAHFVVRVVVQDATGGCAQAPDLAAQRAREGAGAGFWTDTSLIFGLAMVAAAGLTATLAFVSFWRIWKRREPGVEPGDRPGKPARESAAKPPAKPPTRPPTKPADQPPTKPADQPPTKPADQPPDGPPSRRRP